jgi:hypothetical protein
MRSYYRYDPSLPAAIVVSVLYSLAFIGIAVQWLRHKSWVWIIMILAAGSKSRPTPELPLYESREANHRGESGGRRLYCTMHLDSKHKRQEHIRRPVLLDCAGTRSHGCRLLCYICTSAPKFWHQAPTNSK